MPSFKGVLAVRLVIVGTIIIIVPLIALFLFHALSFLAPIFDSVVCISTADDVAQVAVVPTTPSITLLLWSDAAGRVPTGTADGQARDPSLHAHGRRPDLPRSLRLASPGCI
jgi:hypothetical protein